MNRSGCSCEANQERRETLQIQLPWVSFDQLLVNSVQKGLVQLVQSRFPLLRSFDSATSAFLVLALFSSSSISSLFRVPCLRNDGHSSWSD